MANTVKQGTEVTFNFIFDKETDNKITSVEQLAAVISNSSTYAVMREFDSTELEVFEAFVAPDNSQFPGTDGYLQFKFKFDDVGRFDVRLCYVDENNSLLNSNDDDTIDKVFTKTKNDNLIELDKVSITVYNTIDTYTHDSKIDSTTLKDKGV